MNNNYKNLSLKTKATIGFVLVFLIMFSSAMVGLVGLLSNSHQFSTFNKLTEEAQLSNEIDSYLYGKRLAFKKYETSNNREFINQYNEIDAKMKLAVARFLEISKDKDRKNDIKDISEKSGNYQKQFDTFIKYSNDIAENYKELSINGTELLDALSIMNETAQDTNNFEVTKITSNALTHLLSARLRATKYFDFHSQSEFDQYLTHYQLFEEDIALLQGIEKRDEYKSNYYALYKYQPLYKTGMQTLRQNIEQIDRINKELDLIGPQISIVTAKIKASVLDEVNQFNNRINKSNQQSSITVGIIFLVAILLGSFVIISILKLVLNPINFLKETFESIASGDANTDFRLPESSTDEIGQMAVAFNIFMLKIEGMIKSMAYQNLLKTSENDLSEIARTEDDLEVISNQVVHYLCKHFDMLMGAMYIPNEDGIFNLSATYAYTNPKGSEITVECGVGIIGQVIKEKKIFVIHELPEEYILIQSGLGEAKPHSIIVIPCLYNEDLMGIIELASFEAFNTNQMDILEALSDILGRILSTVKVRHQMKILLEKTLNQSQTLQIQQEELRQSNEELEEQARALKDSEGKLQLQQEELRVTNEELETHSKQLEEQKRVLNEKNSALEIAQEEMMKKAEALQLANKYKSEFLANMSHELRTPLNSILVLSQLLSDKKEDEPLSDKEKSFASTIHSSGKDLLTLINGVLDLSKVEAGKLNLHNEKVFLTELLNENENMFETMADMKNLDLNLTIEENAPEYIVSDSLRLNQILKNLISNAIKFTHDGYVSVRFRNLISKEAQALNIQSKDYLAIVVKDTGIGIPTDKLEEVFEAFKQSDGTTSRQYGGTGLGLTISLEMAKLLGGHIILESEVGKGSEFILIIPRKPNDEKKESNLINAIEMISHYDRTEETQKENQVGNETNDQVPIETALDSRGKKVLIIEDDPTFAQILSDLAEEKGYIAIKAFNGKEGIKRAKEDKPTGIILDIGLPDMDGMILAKMLSEDNATKDIPIHVISGSEDISEAIGLEGMPQSIIGFLKKPVDIKSIYKTLSKIESVDVKGTKQILVVGACGDEDFSKFAQLGQVQIQKVMTGSQAIEALKTEVYACIILDVNLPDTTGVDFMTNIRQEFENQTPIIIYTEAEINTDEIDDMHQFAESIILKSSKSKERLVDEVSLFLHDVERSFKGKRPISKIVEDDKNSLLGVRVLLADDDNRNVFALMHLLEQNGMQVVVAKDGFEAIKKFEENEIELVLMDIMMPQMDGYDAIKQIRQTAKGRHTPIIALTAKAMSDDRDKCITAGANDYLTKPVDVNRLLSMIKVWMS